jgi:hypothetical protein
MLAACISSTTSSLIEKKLLKRISSIISSLKFVIVLQI